MEEIWKDIEGYEGRYQVSNMGRIRSLDMVVNHNYGGKALKKGRILKQHISHRTRCQVGLIINGVRKYPLVSRIVYATFNGPIPDGMQVNHIDENPLNNRLDNLNLMTPKENTNYGTGIERRSKTLSKTLKGKYTYADNPNSKQVIQYDLNGNPIRKWECIKTAAEHYGIKYNTIWCCIKGKCKTAAGYKWSYVKRDAA